MRITRAVTLAATTATLLLGLMAPAMSTPETSGQCPEGGVKVQGQGPSTIDVDGTRVTATISDETVSFTDGDGKPIDVTFCVKSSDDNSSTQTGSSWTVQLENDGGQTPAISHVVLYGLSGTADDTTCSDTADMITDSSLVVTGEGGTATGTVTTDIPAGCEVTVTLVSYFASGDSWPSNLPQEYNEHVTETFTTSGVHSVGPVDVPDCYYQVDLVRGEEVIHELTQDDSYGPRKLQWETGGSTECAEILSEGDANDGDGTNPEADGATPGTTVPPAGENVDGTDVASEELAGATVVPPGTDDAALDATIGAADGADADADQLAATGLPLVVLVLLGLGALVAGTGVLTTGRRR